MSAHLDFVWSAFWDLSNDRPIGLGSVGAIPWSAIDRYAERYGVRDPDAFDRFCRLIRGLDTEWRARAASPPSPDPGKSL